jgi:hypothetical protein
MTQPERTGTQARTQERRRSPRISKRVPVQVDWTTPAGEYIEVEGYTEIVSAHGALLNFEGDRLPLSELRVRNLNTGAVVWAGVVSVLPAEKGRSKLAVTFATPDPAFWGEGVPPPFAETG